MIIIQLKGGLGNQMFQYALYIALKNRGKTVKIDDETGFVNDKLRTPVLAGYGIDYDKATKEEVVAAVLDIDSKELSTFDETDRLYLEGICRLLPLS